MREDSLARGKAMIPAISAPVKDRQTLVGLDLLEEEDSDIGKYRQLAMTVVRFNLA